ncbi:hypothetical protein RRG08_017503 [Elysia crispata]|uniref:Uncharacterized protein n=1 Tax=Elysia crispata TaxID=231223 RepID=A0AAE1DCZ1_9GAST|nr:hypothetical protein RRG08_017503 [Elysia crispata]
MGTGNATAISGCPAHARVALWCRPVAEAPLLRDQNEAARLLSCHGVGASASIRVHVGSQTIISRYMISFSGGGPTRDSVGTCGRICGFVGHDEFSFSFLSCLHNK